MLGKGDGDTMTEDEIKNEQNILSCLLHNQRVWQEAVVRANAQLQQAEQGMEEATMAADSQKKRMEPSA